MWYTLRSRILQLGDDGLHVAQPTGEEPVPELTDAMAVSLSFKIKHHKHIFNAVVKESTQWTDAEGGSVPAWLISMPRRMQRVQRRAYHRVEVPRSRSPLATFWPGGLAGGTEQEAAGFSWEGWLTNMSAGGFQVRLISKQAPKLEVGDVVGVRMDMGQGYEPILADAQFRHELPGEGGIVFFGFQFVGLGQSLASLETLRRIGQIVCEFQRVDARRRSRVKADPRPNVPRPSWRSPSHKPSGAK